MKRKYTGVSVDGKKPPEKLLFVISHHRILFSHKKKMEIFLFTTTWINLGAIILNKISQTDKDKYSTISLTYGKP